MNTNECYDIDLVMPSVTRRKQYGSRQTGEIRDAPYYILNTAVNFM